MSYTFMVCALLCVYYTSIKSLSKNKQKKKAYYDMRDTPEKFQGPVALHVVLLHI